jgi:hypothetical protein
VKFHVDLGVGDEVQEPLESVEGQDWLGFTGIANRRGELEAQLKAAKEPPPLLHPSRADLYRAKVGKPRLGAPPRGHLLGSLRDAPRAYRFDRLDSG